MLNQFDIPRLLLSIIGYKGLPYPGAYLNAPFLGVRKGQMGADDFPNTPDAFDRKEFTDAGSRLRKKDVLGRWYFMPVLFKDTDLGEWELPEAVVNVTAAKEIKETTLVAAGTVIELISAPKYNIQIAGYISGSVNNDNPEDWPEIQLGKMRDFWHLAKSVELQCALTDLLIGVGTQVVLTDLSLPPTPGVEDGQVVSLKCTADNPFELIIE